MPDLIIKPQHVQPVRWIAVLIIEGDEKHYEFTEPHKAVAFEAEQLQKGVKCKLYSKQVSQYYYDALVAMGL